MSKIASFGRFLDQPILVAKFDKRVPLALAAAGTVFGVKETLKTSEGERKKFALKTAIIMSATIFSAIKAPKIADLLIKRAGINQNKTSEATSKFKSVLLQNKEIVDEILENSDKIDNETIKLLEKSKQGKILSLTEVCELRNTLSKENFNKLIPEPESVTSKDIFKEIGWLSIFGAVPVIGGIIGGIGADYLTEKNWQKGIDNKIKEGIYQYLANIFMCNVGAGAALFTLEKFGIKSNAARCIGMVTGIILTGVIGGSYIANFIGNKIINPLLSKNSHDEQRKPEIVDIGLHTDDIATVAVLSGLRWIEPALPFLYTVSGYRAGIGYRNSANPSHNSTQGDIDAQQYSKKFHTEKGKNFCTKC